MAAFSNPSLGICALERTAQSLLSVLLLSDVFCICEAHSEAQWKQLLDAGYEPKEECFADALEKTATSAQIGWCVVERVLQWFASAALRKEAICELLADEATVSRMVTFNASRKDLFQMLRYLQSVAPAEFDAAMQSQWRGRLPLLNYLLAADDFESQTAALLWPSDASLLTAIGDAHLNVFHYAVEGDALKDRDDSCVQWLKLQLGDSLLAHSDDEPMAVYYLSYGGANIQVIEALFHKKQLGAFMEETHNSVFHNIAMFSLSLPVAKAMRRLLGEERSRTLLKRKTEDGITAAQMCIGEMEKRKGKMNEIPEKLLEELREH